MNVRTVGIVTKPQRKDVARVASELADWLTARGIRAILDEKTADRIGRPDAGVPVEALGSEADLLVVVGGDGTLLAAARLLRGRNVPILAINYGSLGFLTAAPLRELYPDLDRVLTGQWSGDFRMMLEVTILRGTGEREVHSALNDLVVNKGTPARIIELDASVDDVYVSTFRADGLIVATPTGSTAYNLSAGGPIVHPDLKALLLTPICSHTLTNRPIVLPAAGRVTITFKAAEGDDVQATIDGQVARPLAAGDRIEVAASSTEVHLIATGRKTYFDVLRGKLKWG